MNLLLLIINMTACAVTLVAAMAIFLRRHPDCVQAHIIQLSLLAIAVGSFAALIAPLYSNGALPHWWGILFRVGIAVIAARGLARSIKRIEGHDPVHP